jgi:hypothetical protein
VGNRVIHQPATGPQCPRSLRTHICSPGSTGMIYHRQVGAFMQSDLSVWWLLLLSLTSKCFCARPGLSQSHTQLPTAMTSILHLQPSPMHPSASLAAHQTQDVQEEHVFLLIAFFQPRYLPVALRPLGCREDSFFSAPSDPIHLQLLGVTSKPQPGRPSCSLTRGLVPHADGETHSSPSVVARNRKTGTIPFRLTNEGSRGTEPCSSSQASWVGVSAKTIT